MGFLEQVELFFQAMSVHFKQFVLYVHTHEKLYYICTIALLIVLTVSFMIPKKKVQLIRNPLKSYRQKK